MFKKTGTGNQKYMIPLLLLTRAVRQYITKACNMDNCDFMKPAILL